MPGETPPKHTKSSPLIPRDTGSKVSEWNAIMDGGYTSSALCGRHGVWIRFAVASVVASALLMQAVDAQSIDAPSGTFRPSAPSQADDARPAAPIPRPTEIVRSRDIVRSEVIVRLPAGVARQALGARGVPGAGAFDIVLNTGPTQPAIRRDFSYVSQRPWRYDSS